MSSCCYYIHTSSSIPFQNVSLNLTLQFNLCRCGRTFCPNDLPKKRSLKETFLKVQLPVTIENNLEKNKSKNIKVINVYLPIFL